jgi:HNH endonuclease
MRRVQKSDESEILTQKLFYKPGNSERNRQIRDLLLAEQKGFCAYTDEYISRTDAADIDHFNPSLKNTNEDNYNNWFAVKHKWNNEKSSKWQEFQPVLHPTASDFEERIVYNSGDYFPISIEDEEATNLIKLLKLDDPILADNRKKYIRRKRAELEVFKMDVTEFFQILANEDPRQVSYLRAIKEEFGLDLWDYLR